MILGLIIHIGERSNRKILPFRQIHDILPLITLLPQILESIYPLELLLKLIILILKTLSCIHTLYFLGIYNIITYFRVHNILFLCVNPLLNFYVNFTCLISSLIYFPLLLCYIFSI